MPRAKTPVHPTLKSTLGFDPETPDEEVLDAWKAASTRVAKPCWELHYCPYGPLVEEMPLLPPRKADAFRHHTYLQECLDAGVYGEDKKPLDESRRAAFERMVEGFDPEEYPDEIPQVIADSQCAIFGHVCPVVLNAEPFSETSKERDFGRRNISFKAKMRVARRDNHTCQICGKHLRDEELEYDHIIPIAKGGSNEEHNIRLTCFDCNRRKSARPEL